MVKLINFGFVLNSQLTNSREQSPLGEVSLYALDSSFTNLDSTAALHTNNNMFMDSSCKTGDQLYNDTSPNGECSLDRYRVNYKKC